LLRTGAGAEQRVEVASSLPVINSRKKAPRDAGLFLFQWPRTRAAGVSVDPLGSVLTAMGPSVFPEMFMGLVAIRPVWPPVTPVVRPGIRADGVGVDPLGSAATAMGVSVDPLGLAATAMGPSVFPEMFMGLVAIWPVWPTVTPVVGNSVPGRATVTPVVRYSVPGKFIGVCAKANVAGSVKASASAIVVSFMGFSLRLDKRRRGKPGLIIPLNTS
jgi:hypothetical protein